MRSKFQAFLSHFKSVYEPTGGNVIYMSNDSTANRSKFQVSNQD